MAELERKLAAPPTYQIMPSIQLLSKRPQSFTSYGAGGKIIRPSRKFSSRSGSQELIL
jgi:hypothetical protein